jgi:hypothetical protein
MALIEWVDLIKDVALSISAIAGAVTSSIALRPKQPLKKILT